MESKVAAVDPKPSSTAAPAVSAGGSADSPLQLVFDAGSDALSAEDQAKLKALVAGLGNRVETDSGLRVMLKAYASGSNRTASQARRLSLSRALAVRTYLIGEGLPGMRMDVRALGAKTEGTPEDRVDVVVRAAGQ